MRETQWRERTALAHQRSTLALVLIACLLAAHGRDALSVAAALLIVAVALAAREPRHFAFATLLAAACAAVAVTYRAAS
jgi:hypothetical protein